MSKNITATTTPKPVSATDNIVLPVETAEHKRYRARIDARIRRRKVVTAFQLGLIYIFLIVMAIFALFPIYFVVQASFAGSQNLYTTDLHLLPVNPSWDNYVYAFTQEPLLAWLGNTLFVCGLSTVVGLFFSMTGAYALSRFRFKGRKLSLDLLLVLQAFPGLLVISAYYYLLQYLNLLDSAPLFGLSMIYVATSIVFSCWNIKGYFDTLPIELDQAAIIDGASQWEAFWRVIMPLAAPALAASGLLIFVGGWSEFAIANYILNANDTGSNLTFILGLYRLQGDFRTPWGYFAATSIIISVPLVIVFLLAQRFFKSGLTIGSVKG
ncbi:sugar ABC transporter permease [Dictyobacter formicarum]|uniref:ABC transporter permease n=1 Tax=Dictyobacter formicarum TaxID=2778368 RepID=A0ABQ3VLR7_9CHLR|nr:ABC transporter permease subunit [Dictyobacter formicarum]GHO86558.1 ABC transporter permease [Dictyobacter formicarum]